MDGCLFAEYIEFSRVGKCNSKRKLITLFPDEFDAAVLGAAFFGLVVGDWLVAALADGAEVPFINTEFHKLGHDGLGALLAERVIYLVGTLVVAVALDLETYLRIFLHIVRNCLDVSHRLRLECCLAGLEEDVVGHKLAGLLHGLLHCRKV